MRRDASTGSADATWVPSDEDDPAGQADPDALVGRYRIEGLLGRGASSQVHTALDTLTGERVAIKFVARRGPGTARQIRRELTALRLLALPGVVTLYDDGELPDGQVFLVMERLLGGRFDTLAERGGWEAWAGEARTLLEALARVHFAGVVHRDLKPANILLNDHGRPVITDFGLAQGRAVETPGPGLREGSPRYMAPEQRRGQPSDERTDLYALGVMFSEMIADRAAPAAVHDVVAAMQAEAPEDRPASVLEVLDAVGAGTDAVLGSRAGLPPRASKAALRGLFAEPEVTFLHVAEDAAAVLHQRTRGTRAHVAAELERWVRAGRCHWDGPSLAMDRAAVDALQWEQDPELLALVARSRAATDDALADDVASRGRALHLSGRGAQALGLLDGVLAWLTGPRSVRVVLEELVCVALALASDDAIRLAMYRCERGEAPDLEQLLKGARLSWRGDRERAIELLSTPLTGEPELTRWGLLVTACCAAAPDRLPQILDEARHSCAGRPVAEGRWHLWQGNAAYALGDYATSLDHGRKAAARLGSAPVFQMGALVNAGFAALELPDLEVAEALAAEARALAQRLRYGLIECIATTLARNAALRRRDPVPARPALVQAAFELSGRRGVELALVEAALAYRHGDTGEGAHLAARALDALGEAPSPPRTVAAALCLACGGHDRCDDDDLSPLAPSLRAQAEALLVISGRPRPPAELVQQWLTAWVPVDPDQPADVLSWRECADTLGQT